MADTDKFSIEIQVNADKATKQLDSLDARAKKTQETLEKPINIPGLTDAEGVDRIRKVDKELKNVDESVQKLGSNTEDMAKQTKSAFNVTNILAFTSAITAAGYVVKKTFDGITGIATSLVGIGNTAKGLGITPTSLKAWDTTFSTLGVPADASQFLNNIQNRMLQQKAHADPYLGKAFSNLGVSSFKNADGSDKTPEQVALEIIKGSNKLNPDSAKIAGGYMGIDPATIMSLRGNTKFASTLSSEKKRLISSGEIQSAQKLQAAEADFARSFEQLIYQMTPLINGLTKIINLFTSAIPERKDTDVSLSQGILNMAGLKGFSFRKLLYKLGLNKDVNIKAETPEIRDAIAQHENPQHIANLNANGAIGLYGIRPHWAKAAFKKAGMPEGDYSESQLTNWLMNPVNNLKAHNLMFAQDLKDQGGSLRNALQEYGGTSYNSPIIGKIMSKYIAPSSAESAAVSNAISTSNINNAKNSNVNNTTHINGNIHVSANNPAEFGKAMSNQTKYLNAATNSIGQVS